MACLEPPFTEEVIRYSVTEFPFADNICRAVLGEDLVNSFSRAEQLARLSAFESARRKGKARANLLDEAMYHRFLCDVVCAHLGEEFLIFQRSPDVRFHLRRGRSLVGPHSDADYKHSPYEINFWVPLTAAFGTNSLWAESSPQLGDYHPFDVSYGDAVRFYGNQCLHFTEDNDTDQTRVSFDFRVVRLRDFTRSGIPMPGCPGHIHSGLMGAKSPWVLFRWYGIIGPAGVVDEHDWAARAFLLSGVPAEWTLLEDRFFEGIIKCVGSKRGFGFIYCADICASRGTDVFFHVTEAHGCTECDSVSFRTYVNKDGQLRAAEIQRGSAQDRVDIGILGRAVLSPSNVGQALNCGLFQAVVDGAAKRGRANSMTTTGKLDIVPLQRARSSSDEHRRRCEVSHGSERLARRNCARCSWLGNRSRLARTLMYKDASGSCRPWITENPDPTKPWGLGCIVCSTARSQGGHQQIPQSAFTEFTFGSIAPCLCVQPLVRHGNHDGRRAHRIARNDGHAAAILALTNMQCSIAGQPSLASPEGPGT